MAYLREKARMRETLPEEWYKTQGQKHRAGVGGRGLQEQCVEVVKRDVTRHLALLPYLPAEVRERLLAAFIQGRLLDARLLQSCIQNGLYSLDLTKATRFGRDSVAAVLQYCPHIHTLNLTDCLYFHTDETVRLVRGLPNLRTLILDGLEVETQDLAAILCGLPAELRNLSLRDCTVLATTRNQAEPFAGLQRLSNLAGLWLSNLSAARDYGERTYKYKLPAETVDQFLDAAAGSLRCLDLSNTNVEFNADLSELDYSKGDHLTLTFIHYACPTDARMYCQSRDLRRLFGRHEVGERFKSTTLSTIGHNLHHLSLAGCGIMTTWLADQDLHDLISLVPHLVHLDLGYSSDMSVATLRHIGQCCSNLRYLNIRHCRGNLEPSAFFLGEECVFAALEELDIFGCLQLSYRQEIINGQHCRFPSTWVAALPSLERLCVDWTSNELADALYHEPALRRLAIRLM